MPNLRALRVAPVLAVCTLGLSATADAQEVLVGPPPQMAPPQAPPPQLAPIPQQQPYPQPYAQPYPQQPYPQQQPYQAPMYQAPVYGQPYYQPPGQPTPATPRVIHSWDGGPIPPGYHEESHARLGLVITGACLFGTFYLFTSMAAAISNDEGSSVNALYVPVFGPFIQAGETSTSTGAFFLALDGLVQAGGVTMFALGLAMPKKELVRNDLGVQWSLKPMIGRNQTGMGVVGSF